MRNHIHAVSRYQGIGWPVAVVVGAKLILHLTANALGGYGYFRDELYYIACSDHPDFGYVDHPPFSIFLLLLSRSVFGDSLFALRLLPALAGAGTVLLAALMAREMGGGIFARSIAALSVLVSPVFLGMQTIYSMNAFDVLVWSAAGYVMLRIINRSTTVLWVVLGCLLGLGLLNKISVLFLGFGIAAGLLFPDLRRYLRTQGPWLCGALAFLLFLPYIVWNVSHDNAHLEFIRNASAGKYSDLTRLRFIMEQFLINNPFNVPIWCGGLWYFFSRNGRHYRWLGVAFVGAAAILIMNGTSKAEYLAAGYPMLFAGGGVLWEGVLSDGWRSGVQWILVGMLVCGLFAAPFGLPILPPETYVNYAHTLGISPSTSENQEVAELPQFYADMFGWEDQVKALALAYQSLPLDDRKDCVLYCQNYGRAGAVDFFGRRHGLPNAISGHNNYWYWIPDSLNIGTVILMDDESTNLGEIFGSVQIIGTHHTSYAMPYENNLVIYVCRNPKGDPGAILQRIRHFQ